MKDGYTHLDEAADAIRDIGAAMMEAGQRVVDSILAWQQREQKRKGKQ